MRFYTHHHTYYCGIDLHARSMYVCILDQAGTIVVHKNVAATPEAFLRVIAPYREDLAVAVEYIFTWYWLSDLCAREGIAFVLGHALYLKAIHGGKAKTDKIDAHQIAVLLRGACCREPMSIPPSCGPPALCSAAAVTSCASGRRCWPTCRIPTVSPTSPSWARSWPTRAIGRAWKNTSPTLACAKVLRWTWRSLTTTTN